MSRTIAPPQYKARLFELLGDITGHMLIFIAVFWLLHREQFVLGQAVSAGLIVGWVCGTLRLLQYQASNRLAKLGRTDNEIQKRLLLTLTEPFPHGIFLIGPCITFSVSHDLTILYILVGFYVFLPIIRFLIPISIKPALKYSGLNQLSFMRKTLDRRLSYLLLQTPDTLRGINSALRNNLPYEALRLIVVNTEASAAEARALLPRIAAQDLKQLFPS